MPWRLRFGFEGITTLGLFTSLRDGLGMPAKRVGCWRWLIDLAQWVSEEFGISVSQQTLSRDLRAMGYRKLSARPRHHAQDAEAMEAFKKTSPPAWTRSPGETRRAGR